jgi:hypothetical protein
MITVKSRWAAFGPIGHGNARGEANVIAPSATPVPCCGGDGSGCEPRMCLGCYLSPADLEALRRGTGWVRPDPGLQVAWLLARRGHSAVWLGRSLGISFADARAITNAARETLVGCTGAGREDVNGLGGVGCEGVG